MATTPSRVRPVTASAASAESERLARISTSPPISERAERPTVSSMLRAKLPTATMAATPTVTQATK